MPDSIVAQHACWDCRGEIAVADPKPHRAELDHDAYRDLHVAHRRRCDRCAGEFARRLAQRPRRRAALRRAQFGVARRHPWRR